LAGVKVKVIKEVKVIMEAKAITEHKVITEHKAITEVKFIMETKAITKVKTITWLFQAPAVAMPILSITEHPETYQHTVKLSLSKYPLDLCAYFDFVF
jgi:hypothetical protein